MNSFYSEHPHQNKTDRQRKEYRRQDNFYHRQFPVPAGILALLQQLPFAFEEGMRQLVLKLEKRREFAVVQLSVRPDHDKPGCCQSCPYTTAQKQDGGLRTIGAEVEQGSNSRLKPRQQARIQLIRPFAPPAHPVGKLRMKPVELKQLARLRTFSHYPSALMARMMLSVFHPTIASAASRTTAEIRSLPLGLIAMMGFGLLKPSMARKASVRIHLL